MSDKKVLNVLLVEDEQVMRDVMISYIAEHPFLRLKGVCADGEEALEKLSGEKYDLCFLDIGLPVFSGMEVLARIKHPPYIIFVTVSASHAIQAFELGAVDYLHKPFDRERFNLAVERAEKSIHGMGRVEKPDKNNAHGLLVREKEDQHVVPFQEVVYVTSHGGHSVIHCTGGDYEVARNILDVERMLPTRLFLRIHKQSIINVNYVARIQYLAGGRYQIYLKDDDETDLVVGRRYVTEFKKRFPG